MTSSPAVDEPKFQRAYVVQNTGHDFSELLELCSEIVFVTSGYDEEYKLMTTVIKGLTNFSPRRDIIVPVGNVFVNLLVGMVVAELSREWGSYNVAIYREKMYHVQNISGTMMGEMLNVISDN